MLKLYYTPLSVYSRPVWIMLIEKGLEFQLVSMKLDGDQIQPDFLAISPFNHVPVLVDNNFTAIESLAILDYLEAQYPIPVLLPNHPNALAVVRMVQMVTMNELLPSMILLIRESKDVQKQESANTQIAKVLDFFESLLCDSLFFAGEQLTLAEVVAGSVIPLLPNNGISLLAYPKLKAWSERLIERDSWQNTQPSPEEFEIFKRRFRVLPRVRKRLYR
ncbi:glutathione S-transferase [Dulcicalothrix desertica PCC 7102]|uniref:Glutathione S-transferase n=1 Tax=Dulcicalothrix desertica PCC 7102 TaxID=232991 RepID=A0A3S1AG72_9CYAN|nr:glutathione S-transferase family protein [Dulcicalothrix desertica]RUT00161.1 glutathione S-transferase [Dulcicalothrix desertica PCC 7102]TWH55628.1 glutathione S-transferase [Dulcicalothrix desertica PCC 7102]